MRSNGAAYIAFLPSGIQTRGCQPTRARSDGVTLQRHATAVICPFML